MSNYIRSIRNKVKEIIYITKESQDEIRRDVTFVTDSACLHRLQVKTIFYGIESVLLFIGIF
jgi:hypothetical protein